MKKFSKIILTVLFIVLALSCNSFAFDDLQNAISLGYLLSGSSEIAALSWKPDFKWGTWALGFDFNLPMGQVKPVDYSNIVFRYAEYNDGQKGLRYGMLDNLTYGRGLIMKNYTSRSNSDIIPTNNQMSTSLYFKTGIFGFYGMGTWSQVYAVRATQQINPMVTLGESYVTDTDGPTVLEPNGVRRKYPPVSGMSVDMSVPLPYNFEGYAEAAQLMGHGNGLTAGIDWASNVMDLSMSFNAGYRSLDKGFAPGYFNEQYESNPIDLVSYEATGKEKNGEIVELYAAYSNLSKLGIIYENYNGSNPSLTGDLKTVLSEKASLALRYSQPNFVDFRSLDLEQGAIIIGALTYKLNANLAMVLNYKKAYDPVAGKVVESQYYEMKFGI